MKKIHLLITILTVIGLDANAQEKSSRELQGDKYAFTYSYDKAINSYTHADALTVEGQRKLAESYYNIHSNTEAEEAYAKLVNSSTGVLPEDYYNYAMILKTNGKYDESGKMMDKFSELKPTDLRAKSYMTDKAELANLLKDNGKYKVTNLDINTASDDFGTSFYQDKIVFASTRANPKMIVRKDNRTGEPYLNMFVSDVEGGQFYTPVIFDKGLDGKLHDGPASFNKEGTLIAFTRNHYRDKSSDKIVELQIYFSHYINEEWDTPVPFAFNNTAYSVGHPSLSADGSIMYFASDMPGGYGKSDIYKTTKDQQGTWSKPENMGDKVNTESDEVFPFFESTNRILFFASNGRFGLGGLDIFVCEMQGLEVSRVYNAGSPVNTQDDDFSLILNDTLNRGYLSSNRSGGNGFDDIYSVELLKPADIQKRITGIAKNIYASPLPKTLVTLFDENGKVIDTLTTKENGAYSFSVPTDKKFKLVGQKESYLDGDTITNTFGKELIVKADVILLTKKADVIPPTKKEVIAKKIVKDADLAAVLELNTIYFDLDKFNIRPDAKKELDKIVDVMNEYPGMVVELSSFTDCRASEAYNQILSDKRAKSSAQYIKSRISNPSRISGKGYGEVKNSRACPCENDVVSDCSDGEYQKARNTAFIIVKK